MSKLLSQNAKQNKNTVSVKGPFNFEKYPELFFDYIQYLKLKCMAYKFSVMDGDGLDVGDKFDKAMKNQESGARTFAEKVYNIFNPIKPLLYERRKEMTEITWEAVFQNKSFVELDKHQMDFLVGLIDCGYIYVLKKKYYIKDKRNGDRDYQTTQYIDMDKMKKLMRKRAKKSISQYSF